MPRRAPLLAALALVIALSLVLPGAASADTGSGDGGTIVVISGDVTVPRGETADGVFVLSGDVRVGGHVDGDVLVLSGDVLLAGSVSGDLMTMDGRARLLDSAEVGGDVRYGDQRPDVSSFATVGGDVTDDNWGDAGDALPFIGGIVLWLAISFSFLLLGTLLLLFLPRAADALEERSRERIGPTIAIGIAIAICLPLAGVVAAILVLGLPLAIGVFLALAPIGAVAYTVAAYALGRRMVGPPRGRIVAFLAGLAVLRVIAFVPILGILVSLAAVVIGLGLIGAAIGAARQPAAPAEPEIQGS